MIRIICLTIIAVLSVGADDLHTQTKCRMLNGYEGECRHIDRCKPLFELNEKPVKSELELLFLKQSSCRTTSSYRYKVCCPPQSEWWRELQVDPILFPELVNFMNGQIPNTGQSINRTPSTNRVGGSATANPASWNTNQGSNFGQAQAAKRPAFHDQTALNANSYGYDDFSHKLNNNNAHRTGQSSTYGQTTNNLGFSSNQPRRTERPPFQGQVSTNANTYGNAQGLENDQGQRVDQTATVAHNWNVNVDRFENDQTQGVGPTSFKGPFSEHPYKFDTVPPQKFDSGPSQVNPETTPKVQMEFGIDNGQMVTDQSESEQTPTPSNGGDTPNADNQGSDNDQSQQFGDSPADEQIALSVNTDISEKDQSIKGQTAQNSNDNPSAESTNQRCGIQAAVINTGVVGGEAAPEQYPWLALLEYSGGVVNCGGSLISQTHVLTAAHCVDTMRGNPTAVRLSEYNMTTYPVDMAMTGDGTSRPISITIVPIEWSKMHPQFGHSHYQHDIGLVKMTRQVDYTDFVRPICLPQSDYSKRFDIKTKLLVAGWGTDSSKIEEVKTDSRESYVPIGICNRLVKRALNSKQICAGERPSRRPCVGDYGGPLMLETDNAYVVVGVLSYGPNQCAGGSVPDVSTNVYEYLDWINENMVDSNEPPKTIQS